MRIGLDIMGGDFAPREPVLGAIQAQKLLNPGSRIVLIGDQARAAELIQEFGGNEADFEFVHTTEVIEMGEHPTKAIGAKKNSSITVGFHLLKEKQIDTFISAGNSGAMMVGSIFSIKPIEGVIRPTITSVLPRRDGSVGLLLDVGANADCRPDVLFQFGLLGSIFMKQVYKLDNPRVALLNIGEEKEKGNLASQAAHQLMLETDQFNFVGNVEGRDLFLNKADVVVCDGFTGNIVLKAAESLFHLFRKEGVQNEFLDRFNYEEYGGTPVLGVNAPVIIGHGISNARAFASMIKLAQDVVSIDLVGKIRAAL